MGMEESTVAKNVNIEPSGIAPVGMIGPPRGCDRYEARYLYLEQSGLSRSGEQ